MVIVFAVITESLDYYLIALVSAVLHESGHLAAAKLLGYNIERISVLPVGINGKIKENIHSKADNFIIAVAGPLVNLILVMISSVYSSIHICLCNLYMMILNFLPIPPLDGSRVCNSFFDKEIYINISQCVAYFVIVMTVLLDFLNNKKINVMLIWIIVFTLFSGHNAERKEERIKPVFISSNDKVYELLKCKNSLFIICENDSILGYLKYDDIYNAAIDGLYFLNTKELIAERTKNGYQRIR